MSHAVKPVFNWLQMQRWGVRESDLPSGSEVRFREPSQWEKYRWQTLVSTVLLVQAGLIQFAARTAQASQCRAESRNHMAELAHANGQATAGELSSTMRTS